MQLFQSAISAITRETNPTVARIGVPELQVRHDGGVLRSGERRRGEGRGGHPVLEVAVIQFDAAVVLLLPLEQTGKQTTPRPVKIPHLNIIISI